MTSSKAILIEDVHGTPFVSALRCYSKHHFHGQPPASTHGNSNGNTTTSNLPVRSSAHRRADAHSRPSTGRRRVLRPHPRPIFFLHRPIPTCKRACDSESNANPTIKRDTPKMKCRSTPFTGLADHLISAENTLQSCQMFRSFASDTSGCLPKIRFHSGKKCFKYERCSA